MTLKMTTAQVVKTSVTVTNSSFQNYTHPDNHPTRTTQNFSAVIMKGGPWSTRTTRTSRTTGESASYYRHLEFEHSYDEGRPHPIRTTRSSCATGESASRYRHLEFERSYDEGRALVNSCNSYESCNW